MGLAATVINAVILAFVQWPAASHPILIGWLMAVLGVTAFRSWIRFRFRRIPVKPEEAVRWSWICRGENFLSGLAWGSADVLFFAGVEDSHQIFTAFVLGGMVAGGAAIFSPLKGGFAKGGKYDARATDFNRLIGKIAAHFARTHKEIRAPTILGAGLWTVEVDQAQIKHAVLNICFNASQAMPTGGRLSSQTRNAVITPNRSKAFDVKSGEFLVVDITDTGTGMDKSALALIFDPFFTTKEMGHGTGLGLPCAYGITRNHGGFIENGLGQTVACTNTVTVEAALAEEVAGASIHYTTDGTPPTRSSAIYRDPIPVSDRTHIRAIAVKDGFSDSPELNALFQVRRTAKATGGCYLDQDGAGRIETAVVAFDSNFKAPPTSIAFADPFLKSNKVVPSGKTVAVTTGTCALDPSRPFTLGAGFSPDSLGEISPDSNHAAQSVRMEDRAGPVLASATSFPAAKPAASAEVEITFSEPVALDPDPPEFPLEIKCRGAVLADAEINLVSIHALSSVGYRLVFAPASKYPLPGDSLRINPLRPVKDSVGNRSDMRIFIPVKGGPAHDTVSLSYRLKNGLTENMLGPAVGPVTNPIVIHGEKVCIGCGSPGIRKLLPAMEPHLLSTAGPTWMVTTKYPFDFTLMFFENLGQFVNQARGGVSVADFDLLRTR